MIMILIVNHNYDVDDNDYEHNGRPPEQSEGGDGGGDVRQRRFPNFFTFVCSPVIVYQCVQSFCWKDANTVE